MSAKSSSVGSTVDIASFSNLTFMAKPPSQFKTARPLPAASQPSGDGRRLQTAPTTRATHESHRRTFADHRSAFPQLGRVGDQVSTPLCFTSQLMPRIWGGRALAEILQHPLPDQGPYGEAWELSCLENHVSRVADGPHARNSLADLWTAYHSDLTGDQGTADTTFPWLIKWLECRDLLSVQVHPGDRMAQAVLGQSQGKSEAWIVLEAEPDARVMAGLRPGVSRETLLEHLATGTLDCCLHSFQPRPGDCIQLPAGTIHSAGGGLLIAEIQQPSDATFRLYDWNRVGLDGQPRALQVELALQAVDWTAGPVGPSIPRFIEVATPGVSGELLVDWPEFRIERYTLTTTWTPPHAGELVAWMVVEGAVTLTHCRLEQPREILRGRSTLVPASAGPITWSPTGPSRTATLLCVRMAQPSLPERR